LECAIRRGPNPTKKKLGKNFFKGVTFVENFLAEKSFLQNVIFA
jgi:hypothetical protein